MRLHHLASANEPAAETALNRVMDAIIRAPSSCPRTPPVSFETKTTNGSAPTSTPLTAPKAPTRVSGNSSILPRPVAAPSSAEKTTPQRNPGYAPTATHISSMDPSESTISPKSTPTGAHTAAQASPIKTATRMRLSHVLTTIPLCKTRFCYQHYRVCVSSLIPG